jgi:hypothetical protein
MMWGTKDVSNISTTSSMMDPVPYEILELMVQCFGKAFYYKDPMESFLLSSGVERLLARKHRQEGSKSVWARKLLTELGQSDEGRLIQRRILTDLCKLRNVPDPGVADRNAGLQALRELKEAAIALQLFAIDEREKAVDKKSVAKEKERLIQERASRLEALRKSFSAAFFNVNRQSAGFSLEDILYDLFTLFEFEYRRPYRTPTQQIDGHFKYEGFDYLVEARWREHPPTEKEIGAFKHEVEVKFQSNRGLFVSMPGFRDEVVERFNERGSNIVLMDGPDLVCILEGRIDLRDAIKIKVDRAAQEGIVFTRLGGI